MLWHRAKIFEDVGFWINILRLGPDEGRQGTKRSHHIATVPHVRNAGRPRVQSLAWRDQYLLLVSSASRSSCKPIFTTAVWNCRAVA